MKKLLFAALVALLPATVSAQKPMDVRGLGKDWVETEFPANGQLHMELQSGGVHITGSDDQKVRVRCTGKRVEEAGNARVRLETSGRSGELRVSGGPKNNFEFEIQIPKTTDLIIRMPAGELNVEGVTGNKDVRVHAGEVTIQVGDPDSYDHVKASVWAGEIHGGPFGEGTDGLFRSFHADGMGKYELQVRLKAGEVTFRK
jgi:hypothetical protein